MNVSNINPIARGMINVVLNSSIGYASCTLFKKENPKDIATILAIDSTFRIATKHLFDYVFGSKVDKSGNMVHFAFLLSTGLIQPLSVYLADKLFHAKSKSTISTFGYIALSWKGNIMIKDILRSHGNTK